MTLSQDMSTIYDMIDLDDAYMQSIVSEISAKVNHLIQLLLESRKPLTIHPIYTQLNDLQETILKSDLKQEIKSEYRPWLEETLSNIEKLKLNLSSRHRPPHV